MPCCEAVKVRYGPCKGNRYSKPTALSRGGVGRKLEAKSGADEQKPDIRPVRWGKPAMGGDAQ